MKFGVRELLFVLLLLAMPLGAYIWIFKPSNEHIETQQVDIEAKSQKLASLRKALSRTKDLDEEVAVLREAVEFFELTRMTVKAIKKALKPHSMNLGMNLGRSSGAGIPEHLHMHIVPRWQGDTNFMPVIGKTKVQSVPLEPVYEAVRRELEKL